MEFEGIKYKLNENKKADNDEIPKFSLTYSSGSTDKKRQNSYRIISALKQSKDIIIELDSTLFCVLEKEKELYIAKFIDSLKAIGLDYSYKKMPSQKVASSILTIKVNTKVDIYKIFLHVTDADWDSEAFRKVLPDIGVKYYIPVDNGSMPSIDELDRMIDSEKLSRF
ncbi:MAG: hypothetical protein Q8920_16535, partial [Bacillota bacterium]|nr:hypothetical protein [Bacillota bacterium]